MARQRRPCWHKSGRYWYVKIDGKQRYLSTDEAKAWKKLDDLLYDGGTHVRPLTIRKAADEWLKVYASRDNEWRLARWDRWAGRESLKNVSIDHLDRFAKFLQRATMKPGKGHKKKPKAGYAPKTIRDTVQSVRRVLQWCHDHGWIKRLPRAPKLSKATRRPKDISSNQINDVWKTLGKAKAILTFVLETGCRPSEACGLDWDDVDLRRGVCAIGKHKTVHRGVIRTIALTDEATTILDAIPYRDGPVFRSRLNTPYTPSGLRSILRRRGINGVYALRHTRAQRMLDEGVAIEDVAAWLGHRDLSTVQVYAQVRAERLVKVAKTLKPMVG